MIELLIMNFRGIPAIKMRVTKVPKPVTIMYNNWEEFLSDVHVTDTKVWSEYYQTEVWRVVNLRSN